MPRVISNTPATYFATITPSDTAILNTSVRALYVGSGGTIAAVAEDAPNTVITFNNVTAGTILPIAPHKVMATGTTASNLIALG